MKRYILVIFFFLYFNFLESDKPTLTQRDLVAEYPNEWMYNQRAYPTNFINRNAIEEALIQSKSILAQRESNSSADWNFIGPLNTGGRVTDVAISPDNDAVFVSAGSQPQTDLSFASGAPERAWTSSTIPRR